MSPHGQVDMCLTRFHVIKVHGHQPLQVHKCCDMLKFPDSFDHVLKDDKHTKPLIERPTIRFTVENAIAYDLDHQRAFNAILYVHMLSMGDKPYAPPPPESDIWLIVKSIGRLIAAIHGYRVIQEARDSEVNTKLGGKKRMGEDKTAEEEEAWRNRVNKILVEDFVNYAVRWFENSLEEGVLWFRAGGSTVLDSETWNDRLSKYYNKRVRKLKYGPSKPRKTHDPELFKSVGTDTGAMSLV
ncbi:hypothetical protein FRC11_008466 [Ceratobasidium sp. 423]|nr:hypothetical protein FRC11_008466 [Ceratobasidium sp. 423]